MKTGLIKIAASLALTGVVLAAGCDSDNILTQDITATNPNLVNAGTVSHRHFSVLADDPFPTVIDADGNFTQTQVDITVQIGDRNDQKLTDRHTVFFRTEYGLIQPSCVTETDPDSPQAGSCTVTWEAIKRPEANGPGDDGVVSITAYTLGEEGFTDSNGNRAFDDVDAGFTDLPEPFVDIDESNGYNAGDFIIDVVNPLDPTGKDGQHNPVDNLYNGVACAHSTLCSPNKSIYIWDDIRLTITGPP